MTFWVVNLVLNTVVIVLLQLSDFIEGLTQVILRCNIMSAFLCMACCF